MVAHRAGGDDLQAVAVKLFRVERDLIGDDDHLRMAAAIRIETQRAGAAGHDQADVAVLDAVGRERVVDGLGHRLFGDRNFQPDRLGRIPQPFEVLLQAEHFAAVAAHALEHAVAVEQAVIVDADLGVFLVVRACR